MTAPAVPPLTGREALVLEDAAGITVMAAYRQLRTGDLATAAAAAALLVAGRRTEPDLTLDDVHASVPTWLQLVELGTDALEQLLAGDDGDGDEPDDGAAAPAAPTPGGPWPPTPAAAGAVAP